MGNNMNKQHTKLATLVEDLEVQRDFLAEENASFANYLEDSGYSQNEIDLIAQGWHGSVKERLVENSRLVLRIRELEKSLKDRESRLDSIMGLANDCNYKEC
jgi:hypothetical protein